jgi:uncharacterized protein
MRLARIHFCGVMLAFAGLALAQLPVPELTARVTDLTGTLTAGQRSGLEQKLAAFEERKGAQVAVLMVPTTRPESIEQFGLRVAETWRLGRKGVDDGALLLIAKDDRELRIEVGYGLEGVLTDATSRRIIDETIVPYFRSGDFHGGVSAGVDRIMAVIDGEPLPEPERGWDGRAPLSDWAPILPVVFVFTLTLGTILKRLLGQLLGAAVTGGLVGVFTWLLMGVIAAAILAAVASFMLTLLSRGGPGRWSSAGRGSAGGDFGGGSGGDGGFSGGGGSFGGGGASGRW